MLTLNAPQNIFLNGLNTKYRAFVGGFGSSKTFSGCLDLLIFAMRNPKTRQGYFAPTYTDIRDTFYPTMSEACEMLGFTADVKSGNKEVHLYRGRVYYGTIICRSMDRPDTIVGFKVARALVDEIDILPKDKATTAWNKIVARLRLKIPGVQNGIGVTTTPEGFRFVYSKFKEDPTASYSMVQASTYENQDNLPDDYIPSLIETYPQELIDAYLGGKFVNLTSGTVYYGFNRKTCNSSEVMREGGEDEPPEPLRIGMDFNVGNMSACIYVMRGEVWHMVDELKEVFDTPAMIRIIQDKWPDRAIRVYPDASGGNRKSVNASTSDIALLEQAGFIVYAHDSNPFVKDRVLAANKAFQDGLVKVNVSRCPESAKCLEQLAYDKNGEPDKKSNIDHLPDAATYPIAYEMPVVKPLSAIHVNFPR